MTEAPPRVIWQPQAGGQAMFLSCPYPEALAHGPRAGGKTDALLMSFAMHVGRGFGASWRGILFRQTYPQLGDVIEKARRWFRRIFPEATFKQNPPEWRWPTGESLILRHMARPGDYDNYHGHEYPWIGWEELTNWPTGECYRLMMSTNRSSNPDVPRMVRSTTNPYGRGHAWVKQRFALDGRWWEVRIQDEPAADDGRPEPPRVAIPFTAEENIALATADPDYMPKVLAAASNDEQRKAWADGTWDIAAGGMFSSVWSPANLVPDFAVPRAWRLDRSLDWGTARPFSVGWWAQSDGGDLRLPDGRVIATVRGDLFRMREWYGCTGKPNEGLGLLARQVAKGIVEREILWGWRNADGSRVRAGPADTNIFDTAEGQSPAKNMQDPVRVNGQVYHGIRWTRADKSPGSRVRGWEVVTDRMDAAKRDGEAPREHPGLFVVGDYCPDFLRTMLSLPRDPDNLEDVDTDAEDHIADETRYRLTAPVRVMRSGTTVGMH